MKFRAFASIFAIFAALMTSPVFPAHAVDWLGADTKYWPDCSSGGRSIDCIESVEYSDPKVEQKDPATNTVDYSTISWIKTSFEQNPDWKYNTVLPEMVKSKDACAYHSIGEYVADGCYKATGIKSNGGDVLFHLMTYTGGESMKILQWVDQGEDNPAVREDGWKAITIPVGTTWRITVKSNSLSKELGWIQSNTKNPNISITQGSDGVGRIAITGTVYPAFGGCNVTGEKKPPTTPDEIWCAKPDTYAETMSTGFSIDLLPYKYTTAPMAGSAPGGIIISTNGQQSELRYDREQGILWVPTFGPHFEFDKKTINKGWMETSIKGDVVRKAFKLDPVTASNFAKVEVLSADGTQDVATYTIHYRKVTDTVEIRAYNFHYSAPQVKITLGKPQEVATGSTTPKTSKPTSSIKCVKGKQSKKVTGVNPKCPVGYKKK